MVWGTVQKQIHSQQVNAETFNNSLPGNIFDSIIKKWSLLLCEAKKNLILIRRLQTLRLILWKLLNRVFITSNHKRKYFDAGNALALKQLSNGGHESGNKTPMKFSNSEAITPCAKGKSWETFPLTTPNSQETKIKININLKTHWYLWRWVLTWR